MLEVKFRYCKFNDMMLQKKKKTNTVKDKLQRTGFLPTAVMEEACGVDCVL